jgi:hypothetical protein
MSAWTTLMFAESRRTSAAYWALIATSLVRAVLIAQDFRLTLNHHYMFFWLLIVFLFVPRKRSAIQYFVIFMYVWAGMLKLNPDAAWLSGAALYGRHPLGIPSVLIPAACAYVIVMECLAVFGLLSTKPILFWSTLGQLVLFHIASIWVVGWFYPVLMFLTLSIFPVARLTQRLGEHGMRLSRAACVVMIVFSGAQLTRLAFPGDSSITGEGRLFALNMFDAPVECRSAMTVRRNGSEPQVLILTPAFVNTRTYCDPIVYAELARHFCRGARAAGIADIDLLLESKKHADAEYRTVVSLSNVCSVQPKYLVWKHNWWIQP